MTADHSQMKMSDMQRQISELLEGVRTGSPLGPEKMVEAGEALRASLEELQVTDEPLGAALDEVIALLKESIHASRTLAVEICPPALYQAGLTAALKWLGGWMAEKHALTVRVDCDAQAEPDDPDLRVFLFHAAREMLFNVTKHAKVNRAEVRLAPLDETRIRLRIMDKGVGIEPDRLRAVWNSTGHLGLFSIRERIKLLGGVMEVDSTPNQGTRVNLIVPRRREMQPPVPPTADRP